MLEEKATETGQVQENEANVNTIDPREQLETLTKQLELTKRELSSRDSKISEYSKKLSTYEQSMEELKTANLSETEKLNLKLKELELNVQAEKSERTRATNKAEAIKMMNDLKIDTDLIGLIPLDNVEAMKTAIDTLSQSAQKHMQAGAQEVVNRLGSDVPTGGNTPQGKITREQYNQLSPGERAKAYNEGRIVGIG
jgi:predicted RNase H-like nuclease (RuvC/YqgF family)